MRKIELIYSYDGNIVGDLYPYCIGGLTFSKIRNAVGGINISLSLQGIRKWCEQYNFDVKRLFTPIKSSVILYTDGAPVTGGFLASTPPFTLAELPDATAQLVFADWLGLTAGAYLHPLDTYSGQFQIVAANYLQQILTRTSAAGATWAIYYDDGDVMPSVQGTIDSMKSFKDFLLERTDNTTGTGVFDVYFNAFGGMQIRKPYGEDLSASMVFTYPHTSTRYGVKTIEFSEWANYTSNYYLTGAGNGYGDGGTVITAQSQNNATLANTGYWEGASSESDISDQNTLNQRATSFIFNTDKPYSSPILTLDADNFRMWAHEEGGELWLGDTIRVQLTDWAESILPLNLNQNMRIAGIEATIDGTGHISARLTMMAA